MSFNVSQDKLGLRWVPLGVDIPVCSIDWTTTAG